MNQHHDAFHPGILFGGKGIVLWAIWSSLQRLHRSGEWGKPQDVAMIGIAGVTESEKQR